MKTLLIALSALTITAAQAATIEQIDAATNAMDLKQLTSYAAEQTADYNNACKGSHGLLKEFTRFVKSSRT